MIIYLFVMNNLCIRCTVCMFLLIYRKYGEVHVELIVYSYKNAELLEQCTSSITIGGAYAGKIRRPLLTPAARLGSFGSSELFTQVLGTVLSCC